MKTSTVFALSALAALAVAIPLEKRDFYTTTVIDEVTETVDVVQTVWVQPGDPRLKQQEAAKAAKQQPAAAPAQVTTTPVVAPAPVNTPPQPTSSPAPASVEVPVQQKNVAKPAAVSPAPAPAAIVPSPSNTPVAAPAVAPAAAPAPVLASSSAAAAPVQTPASSPASSGSTLASGPTGGKCGDVGGICSGDATTFDGAGALGSCGWTPPNSPGGEDYFALPEQMMGPKSSYGPNQPANSFCGRKVMIRYNGKEYPATLTDKCGGCASAESIDLSPSLFAKVFGVAPTRFKGIEWYFTTPPINYPAPA
ncbi:hypothetical protein N7G274_006023 [Stereocaulon virgatum]|uniref:RlpA-like protein double-psi beta-barrel domain-containing protein n=1 Tax=Stereocaulon virgatum TaxID=373712 RepID=A0ABR4A6F0_9LECA